MTLKLHNVNTTEVVGAKRVVSCQLKASAKVDEWIRVSALSDGLELVSEKLLEEAIDGGEDFYLIVGLVDGLAELGAVGDAVSEPGGELLHFAGRARDLLVVEHGEVGADHVVALGIGLRVVRPGAR